MVKQKIQSTTAKNSLEAKASDISHAFTLSSIYLSYKYMNVSSVLGNV